MKKLLLMLVALVVSTTVSAVPEDTTAFYQAINAMSPPSAATLAEVANDYMAKCNSGEPSVKQLRALTQTEAYSFRMAAKSMGASEAEWSPDVRTRYAGILKNLDCRAIRSQN